MGRCGRIRGHVIGVGACVAGGSPLDDRTVLQRQNEELAAANERLTARVSELERRLGRNSGNSSMPPSSDTFGRPEKKKAASKSGRKRGRQPGAGGAGLAMTANPDVTEDHVPAACTRCGSALGESDSIGFERRQVRDIPLTT